MPYDQVFDKFKRGQLHSGGPNGPRITSRRQAIAVYLSEKKKANAGDAEYQPSEGESAMREAMKRRKR